MRERNVDIVRRFVEAAERGDLEAVAGLLDPAVRWGGAGDDEGGCHDREEAIEFMRRAFDEGAAVRVERLVEAGELVVGVMGAARPDTEHAGYETGPHGTVVRLLDGRIVEMRVYPSADEALTAAGALA
jgi:ketosteroid isomerase-like protein